MSYAELSAAVNELKYQTQEEIDKIISQRDALKAKLLELTKTDDEGITE